MKIIIKIIVLNAGVHRDDKQSRMTPAFCCKRMILNKETDNYQGQRPASAATELPDMIALSSLHRNSSGPTRSSGISLR